MSNEALERKLGLKESISLVVGTVIGTGVFLKAAIMSQSTGSALWVLIAWVVAGVLSLAGALCYAELGSLYPQAGGEYVYLRKAYGDLTGFLYGWQRFWIGTPGSIAAYGVGAATFLGSVVNLGGEMGRNLFAIALILIFSAVNCFSVLFSGRLQNFMTVLKLFMILGLMLAIFVASSTGTWNNLTHPDGPVVFQGFSAFGTALLAALWAYDGWNNMPMAAGEIRDPGRNIPRALGIGMLIVLAIYCLANLAYFYALPFAEVAISYSRTTPNALPVATKAAATVFGMIAVTILSVAFVFSAIGSMNGTVLTGARIPYAMARDRLFFKSLGSVSKRTKVPVLAVIVQAVISCALALSGTFDQLTDYVIFASWIFYALATGAVFIFRFRFPNAERSYRTPLYPFLPIVFLICAILLLVNTLITAPRESGIGLIFILLGIPVYFVFKKMKPAESTGDLD